MGKALRVDPRGEEQVGQCPGLDPVFRCSAVAQSLKGLPVASLVATASHSWKLGELGLKHFKGYLPTNTSAGPDTRCYSDSQAAMTLMLYLKLMSSWSSAPFQALSHLHGYHKMLI